LIRRRPIGDGTDLKASSKQLGWASAMATLFGAASVHAHVPYFESTDLTHDAPFVISDVEQSKAVYAYLETEDDQDHYLLLVREPSRLYVKIIIPYCQSYQDFRPSFAVTGPGLPVPDTHLPFEVPEGHGAIVMHEAPSGAKRPSMYEFFSDQFYYEGPIIDIDVEDTGDYRLVYWQPDGEIGDYVAIVGRREDFSPADWERSSMNTREIRKRTYIHGSCVEP
jgi:hypothetical protein